MLENVLFLINILKIAMSAIGALSSDFSVCYTFVLKFRFITHQFLLVGVQGLILFPSTGYPRYATNTHTTVFLKVLQLQYMELSKLGFASSLSRKDDRITKSAFPRGQWVSLLAFFSH